jgi:hypothetical protein
MLRRGGSKIRGSMSKHSWVCWVGAGTVILSLSSCSSGGDDTSGSPNGGAPNGGASNGGTPSAGSSNAGSNHGGSANGGSANGGSANGGSANTSGSGGKAGSGGTSAGSGGSGGTLGGAGAGGASSVPDAGAAGSDGGAPDTGPVTCAATCAFNVCAGAACAVTKIASESHPYDVTTVGGAAFWTTIPAISACLSPPCAVATPLVTSTVGHTYTSIATAQSASVDYLFTSDNTGGYGVWRTGLTGTPHDDWAAAQNNAGALAISGSVIAFGDQGRTYRGAVGTIGVTTVMNVGPGFFSAAAQGNEALHNVAIDATSVFAASAADVYKCPVASTCLTNPATAGTSAMPKVMALAIDAGTLYALGGSPFTAGGRETLWSVSTSGGAVNEVGHVDVAIDGQGSPFGLLVDGENLYFGSFDGNLYTCQKSACTPKVFVPGAKPFGLAQDSTYVYWASYWGGGVYRVLKSAL